MNLSTQRLPIRPGGSVGCRGSANLPALLIGASILLVVVGAALSTHVFGLRMMHVVEANRGLDEATRVAIQKLEAEIRSAKDVQVGTGDAYQFKPCDPNGLQSGDALQIYPTNDVRQFIRYYRSASDRSLSRLASGERTPTLVVGNVANAAVFTLENHSGVVLTNLPANRIVHTRLSLSKTASTGSDIGPGKGFDSFEINSKIAFKMW